MRQHTYITVVSGELEAVARWAGTEPVRQHLHLVAFRNDEYVALDGHRMVRVPCKTFGMAFGIEREHVLRAAAAFKVSRTTNLELHADLGTKPMSVSLTVSGSRQAGSRASAWAAVHGMWIKIPAYDLNLRDFPSQEIIESAGKSTVSENVSDAEEIAGHIFDPKFMAAVAEVHGVDEDHENPGVEVVSFSRDRMGAVRLRNAKGIQFLVMPIRRKSQ